MAVCPRLTDRRIHLSTSTANGQKDSDVYQMSAEETTCLQSFCPNGIDYRSQKDQNPDRIPGTCLWTLENPKYLEWRDKNTKKLLWISADPGCGKSVLAKCLVDEDLPRASTDAQSRHILYYFFKDTSPEQRSASRALCAVLHQLFTSCPWLIRHALPQYKERGAKLLTALPELWSIFMTVTADFAGGSIVCIFDALDECVDQERSMLIKYLGDFCRQQQIPSSMSCLTLLVTSRPYFDIQREFERVLETVNDIALKGTDESASIEKEINLVIEHKIESLKHKDRLNQKVTEYLRQRLFEIEHRTYLWFHLLWKIIEESLSGTKTEMDKLIDNLPVNIQGSYEILLEKCPDHGFAKKVLQIVLVAARPLTLDEMDIALCINEQTLSYSELDRAGANWLRDTLSSRCGLMVSVIEGKVYFIHQTVKEFLQKKDSTQYATGVWQESLDLQESHTNLAEACLRNLSFPGINIDHTNYLNSLLPGVDRETQPNEYCLQFVFLSYSAIYWADHYRGSFDCNNNPLLKTLLRCDDQSSAIGQYHRNYGFEIHAASLGGHKDIMQLLLGKGADPNAQSGEYGTALQAASYKGHPDVVQLLLESGADINAQGGYYGTALQAASVSYEGYLDIVRFLLEKGADPNAKSGTYGTALQEASYGGHKDIVQLLLEKGADVNAQGGDYGRKPIITASFDGDINMVRLLLEHKADTSIADTQGWTPLHMACDRGHINIVKILLEAGANPLSITELSETSLHLASRRDVLEMIDLLMTHDYDTEQMDGYGRTCLDWASQYPSFVNSRKWASEHIPTPKAASQIVLQRTIARLIDCAISEKTTTLFYTLGRCLLFAEDKPNASFALQVVSAQCNRCGSQETLNRDHYVCRSCVDTDLCGECFGIFRKDEKPWRCHNHDFIQIPHNENGTPSHDSPGQDWLEWLIGMRKQAENLLD